MGAKNPDAFGSRIAGTLAREHGEAGWRDLIRNASAPGYNWRMSHLARIPISLTAGWLSFRSPPCSFTEARIHGRSLMSWHVVRKTLPRAEIRINRKPAAIRPTANRRPLQKAITTLPNFSAASESHRRVRPIHRPTRAASSRISAILKDAATVVRRGGAQHGASEIFAAT